MYNNKVRKQGPDLDLSGALQIGRLIPSVIPTFIILTFTSVLLWLAYADLNINLLLVVTLSGSLAASDLMDALLKRRDLLSPRVIVSLLMINAVYVSPLLHIVLNAWPKYIVLPPDMESAIFELSIIHLLGTITYFIMVRIGINSQPWKLTINENRYDERSFLLRLSSWLNLFGILSLIAFSYLVLLAGGPLGWVDVQLNYRTELVAPGWLLVISSSFPILFFISYIVSLKLKINELGAGEIRRRIIFALALLILTIFVTSGLRGSRANLIWPALTSLMIVHLLFFKIRAKWIVILAILALAFAGVYDVYKKAGTEGIAQLQAGALDETDSYSELGFGPQALLLGDFSRTAIQSVLLDRWKTTGFDLNWGRTYIGDALLFVPGVGRSAAFPDKQYASTEILYGVGAAEARPRLSTRIYGLQGEALMNFGPTGAVLAFAPYALAMTLAERSFARARENASVRSGVIVSLVVPIVILLFLSDMDNVINNFASKAMFPLLAVFLAGLSSKRM